MNAWRLPIKELLGRAWWRGQANSRWELNAKVYRKSYPFSEKGMFLNFYAKAQTRHPDLPQLDVSALTSGQISDWLFLMQHHGLPTRLLDWTKSFLVASYFAVMDVDNKDEDGVLWALSPIGINKSQQGEESVYLAGAKAIRGLITEVASPKPSGQRTEKVVAVLLPETHQRMLIQQGVATIHGMDTPMNQLQSSEDFLMKLIIDKNIKVDIAQALDEFGITRSYLFPDLDNLAIETQEGTNLDTILGHFA